MESEVIEILKLLYNKDLDIILLTNGWMKGFSKGFFWKDKSYIIIKYADARNISQPTGNIERATSILITKEGDKSNLTTLLSEYI